MPKKKTDVLQGTLDLMVLQTLHSMGAQHGYGIAMRIKQMIGWGIQITAEGARRAGDDEAYGALMAASANLPLGGPIAAMPALLAKYRSYSHVMDWLETPSDSPYWSRISPAGHAARLAERRLPALFIGGWFDTHLTSTVEAYRALSHNANPLSRLIIGPWINNLGRLKSRFPLWGFAE